MRILFEALGFGAGDNLGGSVRVAQANARALVARGHQVTYICTNRRDRRTSLFPGTEERITEDGVRVVYLRTLTIPWWPGSFGPHYVHGAARRLEAELRVHDLLHLHEFRSFLAYAAARAARRAGVPYLLQPHGTLRPGERSQRLKRVYDRWLGRPLLEGASRFIADTESERELFAQAGVSRERSVVVPNGLDLTRLEPLPERGRFRARHSIAPESRMVLFLGRLELTKGPDVLLRAFCELQAADAVLVLVGPDHGLAGQLREMIARAARGRSIVMTGPLHDDREVIEAMIDADVFALPSRYDSFGMVVLEACAASRPMLLSEGCQLAPAFRDRAAIVVPCESKAMASGLRRLLDDPGLRARFGAAGREILVRDYTLPAVVSRLETLYREVLRPAAANGRSEHGG